MVIARDAQQGFFDIAVNFDDIFCSAKLDCLADDGTSDLELLHNGLNNGARDLTAVMGLSCTGGPDGATFIYINNPTISCTGQSPDVTFDVTGQGNVDLGASPSVNTGAYLFGAAVYRGQQDRGALSYWNVAFGLNSAAFAAAGTCTLSGRATASSTAFPLTPSGFALPDNTIYPVVDWSVPLSDASDRVCGAHAINDASGFVATTYVGHAPTPTDFVATTMQHRFDTTTQQVGSAIPTADISQPISTTDAFENATITATDFEFDPQNIFQSGSGLEGGSAIVTTGSRGIGSVAFVSFRAAASLDLAAVRLFSGYDGGTTGGRSMSHFTLYADPGCTNAIGSSSLVLSVDIDPLYENQPGNLSVNQSLELVLPLDVVTTSQCWHAQFTQGSDAASAGSAFVGTRVIELDAFTP